MTLCQHGNRDLTRVRNFKRRCIPIFFHGDGVPVSGVGKSWGKSCDFYNWGSLLAVGPAAEVAFCIWACFLDAQVPDRTKNIFWKLMKWSFDALFAGRWPSRNWDGMLYPENSSDGRRAGEPLVGSSPDHYFCCIWKIKGDLDFYQKELECMEGYGCGAR
jgi:hypothetical protein